MREREREKKKLYFIFFLFRPLMLICYPNFILERIGDNVLLDVVFGNDKVKDFD